MALPEIISILTTIIFGLIAIFFSIREEKHKKALLSKEDKNKQRLYEISILKEIQDRIGYELDIERVVDVVTGSIKNLFPYSTSSSILIKEDLLVFNTYIEESVSHAFLNQVKSSMLASLSAISEAPLPTEIKEHASGVVPDDTNTFLPASFFQIPLIINDKVVGLLNISSTKPGLYKEDEMTILYRITNQAASALSKLEDVLSTEKGKLLAMIASLSDGVFMLDKNNQLLVINQAAKNFLGLEKVNLSIIDILSAFKINFDIAPKLEESVLQKKTIEAKEVKIGNKTIQIIISPVIEENKNTVIGVSVLLHDITLEKNLAQLKEDFTNMIVHELRTPLTSIKGASELLVRSPVKLTDIEQARLLHLIQEQSHRLLDEVSTLLDAAKMEAGRFSIEKTPGDIRQTIYEKVQMLSPQAQAKHITIATDLDQHLPSAVFDHFRIGQVITNLVSNSLKFTPEGGKIIVKVSRVPQVPQVSRGVDEEARDTRDTLDTRGTPNFITVSVSDNGIGIPKEKQETLFSKFSQVIHDRPDIVKLAQGTGLGLYIAKGIVEAHGGHIFLESEEGKGTTVSFTLPIVKTEPASKGVPLRGYATPPSQIFHSVVN